MCKLFFDNPLKISTEKGKCHQVYVSSGTLVCTALSNRYTNGPHIADLYPFSAPQSLLALRFDCAGVNFRMFVK